MVIGTETGFWDPMDASSQSQRTEKPERKTNRQKRIVNRWVLEFYCKATAVAFRTLCVCVPIRTYFTNRTAGRLGTKMEPTEFAESLERTRM